MLRFFIGLRLALERDLRFLCCAFSSACALLSNAI
jgi:hypothetical protein